MIDFDLLRHEPERLQAELKKRFITDIDLAELTRLDEERRSSIAKLEAQQAEHKKQSESIAVQRGLKRAGSIKKAKKLAIEIKDLERAAQDATQAFIKIAALLPNLSHESVPAGKTSVDNRVEAVHGEQPHFDFPVKPHWQLAEQLGGLDSKRGARLAGSRFHYIQGDLVYLQFALLRFAMDELTQHGFVPMLTPVMVKEEALYGAGTFPIDTSEVYKLESDPLYLTGTSEIALLNYHAHETIEVEESPQRFMGYSTNFRREAGAYGKDIKGLIRQHQFDKLELFIFVSQEQSWDFFEKELLTICEGLMLKLGLHFRRVTLSSGDLPRKFQKTYDLETWLPSEQRYLETHSISHAGDFQARRLGIKYKTATGQRRYVHTLNATGFAFSRMPVVILENFQQADGRVKIPEVLQPYLHNRALLGQK
ncbi:MAG: serine--tRNA ligase [bacterium]|nr:serine--tRNA ligase [bacterium]